MVSSQLSLVFGCLTRQSTARLHTVLLPEPYVPGESKAQPAWAASYLSRRRGQKNASVLLLFVLSQPLPGIHNIIRDSLQLVSSPQHPRHQQMRRMAQPPPPPLCPWTMCTPCSLRARVWAFLSPCGECRRTRQRCVWKPKAEKEERSDESIFGIFKSP